jgi:hypothetical protein
VELLAQAIDLLRQAMVFFSHRLAGSVRGVPLPDSIQQLLSL